MQEPKKKRQAATEEVCIYGLGDMGKQGKAIGYSTRRGDMREVCALDLPGKPTLKSSMLHRDSCLVVGVSTKLNLK